MIALFLLKSAKQFAVFLSSFSVSIKFLRACINLSLRLIRSLWLDCWLWVTNDSHICVSSELFSWCFTPAEAPIELIELCDVSIFIFKIINYRNYGESNLNKECKSIQRIKELYKWNYNKNQKIDKMQKESTKHCFKPEINPVSKIIAEKDRSDAVLNKSELTDISMNQQLINISVHDKLHLSRNNSLWFLQQNSQSWIQQQSKGFGSRSNSVADFKTYCSKMQRISEREAKFEMSKGQRLSKNRALNGEPPITPQVCLDFSFSIERSE